MTKSELRQRVWQAMRRDGVERFPGALGRIPNFDGAERAAQLLREMAVWRRALVVKVNTDEAQNLGAQLNIRSIPTLALFAGGQEVARQLRLRDLGGLIVVDFIDMRNKKHIREVERQVKISMKRDKAKVDISKISRFGLMQISRQKMGAPIEKGMSRESSFTTFQETSRRRPEAR